MSCRFRCWYSCSVEAGFRASGLRCWGSAMGRHRVVGPFGACSRWSMIYGCWKTMWRIARGQCLRSRLRWRLFVGRKVSRCLWYLCMSSCFCFGIVSSSWIKSKRLSRCWESIMVWLARCCWQSWIVGVGRLWVSFVRPSLLWFLTLRGSIWEWGGFSVLSPISTLGRRVR